jgi:hypothetical protein
VLEDLSLDYVDSQWFTPVSKPWIKQLVEELNGSPSGDSIIAADTAALLFFILRQLPDDAFPGGKWATIQHLENQIDKCVAAALSRLPQPVKP